MCIFGGKIFPGKCVPLTFWQKWTLQQEIDSCGLTPVPFSHFFNQPVFTIGHARSHNDILRKAMESLEFVQFTCLCYSPINGIKIQWHNVVCLSHLTSVHHQMAAGTPPTQLICHWCRNYRCWNAARLEPHAGSLCHKHTAQWTYT